LIRAHLAEQPQLGSSSLDALRKSNLEVQAVGRNLNQLVRALNAISDHLAHGRLGAAEEGLRSQRGQHVRELVQQIRTTIERHLPLVSQVLTDNVNRWRTRLHARSRSRGRKPGART
jgi:flagellar biosynthesis chaperone FliJ